MKKCNKFLGNNKSAIILKPVVISNYTKNMGEVNRADHFCGSYALKKTSKWWSKMFFWLMKFAIVNSYMLYNMNRKQNDLKDVQHKMFQKKTCYTAGREYLKQECKKRGRSSDIGGIERLSGRHFVAKVPNGKAKDCALFQ